MSEIKMISLGMLAQDKELGITKSKLFYYAKMGLITPISILGKMGIYNEEVVRKTLKEIEKSKKEKLTLKQIKEKINKINN